MAIKVEINLPDEPASGPSRDPAIYARMVHRVNRRMRTDYPEAEFWIVAVNHAMRRRALTPRGPSTGADNTFDVTDGLGTMLHVPAPFDARAWKYLFEGITVVIRYRSVSRQNPYIAAVSGMHRQLRTNLSPSYWPRTHQHAGRVNSPAGVCPAALATLQTWDTNTILQVLRADDLGVWAGCGNGDVRRFLVDESGAWSTGDTYDSGARSGGGNWNVVEMTLLSGAARLWLHMTALFSGDIYHGLRLVEDGAALWTVDWDPAEPSDPLQHYGEPYGDMIESVDRIFQPALTPGVDSARDFSVHEIDPADGAILSTVLLPYVEDITSRIGAYNFLPDSSESAHNLDMGGSLSPKADYGRKTRADVIAGESADWSLTIHGHLAIESGDKLVCVPQVQANQVRAFDLLTEGSPGVAAELWAVEPVAIPDEDEGGEYYTYLPIAGVPENTETEVSAQFLIAWERRTWVHRPAWNLPVAGSVTAINNWLGVHAGIGSGYWAWNEYSWATQDDWDLVMTAIVEEDLIIYSPFDPDGGPNFSYPSDVTVDPDPFAAAEDFIMNGLDVTDPTVFLEVESVNETGYNDATYAGTFGGQGVGDTLTNNSDGVFDFSMSEIVCLNGQANAEENGVYVVTDEGSVSSPWVLTRHTDADDLSEVEDQFLKDMSNSSFWVSVWSAAGVGGNVGQDAFGYRRWVDGEGLEPFVEAVHPGTDVSAHNIWTKSRYGLQSRAAVTGEILASIDLNASLLPTPRFSGTRQGKIGTPTLEYRKVEKSAGTPIAIEDIRVEVPEGKIAGTYLTVAVVKMPVLAFDRNDPIPDTDPQQYEEFEWPEQPYAWVIRHVEGINNDPDGLAADAMEAVYHSWAWLYDLQEIEVEDACPPTWDLSMCAVDTESKTILFPPGQRVEGVLGANPDGAFAVIYGPLQGPESGSRALTFPIPVPCQAAAFEIDTLTHRWTSTLGDLVGHGIESVRSEWAGCNPIICPVDLEEPGTSRAVIIAHGYGTEGNQHKSVQAIVDLTTGEAVSSVDNAEVDSGSSIGAEDKASYACGAIVAAGSVFYSHANPGDILRRRGEV